MNRSLLILLLFPALAIGQELPDRDWLCTAHDAWSLNRWKDRADIVNKKEYAILDIKNNSEILLFNPSKGFKSVPDSFWSVSWSVSKLLPNKPSPKVTVSRNRAMMIFCDLDSFNVYSLILLQ